MKVELSCFIKNCYLDGINLPRCPVVVPLRLCTIFFLYDQTTGNRFIVFDRIFARFNARPLFHLFVIIEHVWTNSRSLGHDRLLILDSRERPEEGDLCHHRGRRKKEKDGKIGARNIARVRASTRRPLLFKVTKGQIESSTFAVSPVSWLIKRKGIQVEELN